MSTPKHPKRPADLNQRAHQVFQEAVGEAPAAASPAPEGGTPSEALRRAAAELGRHGGLKGGKSRAAKLMPEQRAEIARKAAAKRWGRSGPDQTSG